MSSFFCFLWGVFGFVFFYLGSSAFHWNHEYCCAGLFKPKQLPVPSHYSQQWENFTGLSLGISQSLELRYSPGHMWINKRIDTAVQELWGGFGAGKQEQLWVIVIAPDPALKMLSLPHITVSSFRDTGDYPGLGQRKVNSHQCGAQDLVSCAPFTRVEQGEFPAGSWVAPAGAHPCVSLLHTHLDLHFLPRACTGHSARTPGPSWSPGVSPTWDCAVLINSPCSWQ